MERCSVRPRIVAALLFATACLATAASALTPVAAPVADQLLPLGPESIHRALNRGGGELPAADRLRVDRGLALFSDRVGGRWSVLAWNPVTLTPRLVTGSGVPTGAPVFDQADAERTARDFVDAARDLTGLGSDALEVARVSHGLEKWSVHFTQRAGLWPVIGSRFTVCMTETGRIAAFGGDLWPRIDARRSPALSAAQALDLAHRALQARGLAPAASGPRDRIELLQLGLLPASASDSRLVYRIDTFFHAPLSAWLIDIDAESGEVVQLQHVLRTNGFVGTAHGETEDPSFCHPAQDLPAALLEVEVVGVGRDTTDGQGGFLVPHTGSEAESIRVEMRGPWFDVDNNFGDDALFLGEILPGVPFDLYWNDATSRADERDVFYQANRAHEFVKWLDPEWVDLDWQMPANVNLQQSCNAFWSGQDINFFHETTACANTGRLGDVIHHEYGHGITDFMYGPNDPPSDMHEANSDVIGNYLTDESQMGRGFYLDCETGIRDSYNSMTWPDSLEGQGHHDGQILAGFHWDLRQNLMATLGPEAGHERAGRIWHFARKLGLPLNQPEQVWWTFIADDDDGNLDSGTPNWDDICPAAARHGFACPERFTDVVLHHTAFPYIAAPGGQTIRIEAHIYGLQIALNPDSLLVYHRPAGGGAFSVAPMAPAGAPDIYAAEIAGLPVGTLIEYYIYAADLGQHHLTDPRQAPAELHESEVVTVYEPFENECDWIVGSPGDNATQGIWERVDPVGVIVGPYVMQPEDDTTPGAGSICWITGQYDGGYAWFSDADGRTSLISPIYDLRFADEVTVRFQRWFQTFGSQAGVLDIDARNLGESWRNLHRASVFDPDPEWELIEVNLLDAIPDPQQVQFRVVMVGQPNPSLDEGGLDDFMIIAVSHTAGADPIASGPELSLAARAQMPGRVAVRFALPAAGGADLQVLDLTGRVVRRLAGGQHAAGLHEIVWDGRSDEGMPVASGVYFVRLQSAAGERSRRAILAR